MKLFTKELYAKEINDKLINVSKAKWIIKKAENQNEKELFSLFLETEKNKFQIKHIFFGALDISTQKFDLQFIQKLTKEIEKKNSKIQFDLDVTDLTNVKNPEEELKKFGKLVKKAAFLGLGISAILACVGDLNFPVTLGISGLLVMGQTFETSARTISKKRKNEANYKI